MCRSSKSIVSERRNEVKVSVIIPTYKDIQALELIFESLKKQTYKDFEVVIAEDDNSDEVVRFLKQAQTFFPIKHVSQEDIGWRKTRAMNQAIKKAEGEYLIFFDGDCLPYQTFIENHVSLSDPMSVLCGRRVNLGDGITVALRQKKISVIEIESSYLKWWKKLKRDGARHIEQGLDLLTILPRVVFDAFNGKTRLVGCNFSLYKQKMIDINGFDESYPSGDIADDVDIEWRLNAIGVNNKSCKFAANLLHLNHARKERKTQHDKNFALMMEKQKKNQIRCLNGIEKEG